MAYPSKTDRETILGAAVEQLGRVGLAGLSLRSLAASLGIAPNALYRYFVDKSDLEAALSDEAAKRLHQSLTAAATKGAATRSIRAIARAYLRFAREQRALYEMLMLPCEDGHEDPAHGALWAFVVEEVGRLTGEEKGPEAAVALWAYLHGMVSLEAMGVFAVAAKPASSLEFGLKAWIAAAGSGSAVV
jgi:AcrR family transcriptional regulator